MRRLLLLTVCFLTASVLFAGPVTKEQAQQLAQQFLQGKGMTHRAPSLDQMTTEVVLDAVDEEGHPYLYAVTQGKDNGFVIVSGDDRFRGVLGYSKTGSFDTTNMPDNMRAWLQGYVDEIRHLKAIGYQPSGTTARRASAKRVISPMVQTQWNQGTPYNAETPIYNDDVHYVTGCVATAMAQIINYHGQTTGKPSASLKIPEYTSYSLKISVAEVPASTFDWSKMDATYNSSSDADHKAQVARLMKACASSVRMDYKEGGSGASTSAVPNALKTYFGFDETVRDVDRSDYSYSNWIDLIYAELDAARPVLYGGQSSGGGHAFVIDGYDGDELFHVNWGWGGFQDNYFVLSVLNPEDKSGIGAGTSNDGYSYGQDAVIGIQIGTGKTYEEAKYMSFQNLTVAGSVISTAAWNLTGETNTFDYGFAYIDGSANIETIKIATGKTYNDNYGTNNWSATINGTDKPAGTYKIVRVSKLSSASEWVVDEKEYVEAVFDGSSVTLTKHPIISLSATAFNFTGSKAVNEYQPVDVTIKNNGDEFYGILYFFASTTGTKDSPKNYGGITVTKGATTTMNFIFKPTSTGTYNIWVATDSEGDNVIGTTTVTIASAVLGTVNLQAMSTTLLTGDYSTRKNYGSVFKGVVTIKNNDTYEFNNSLRVVVYKYNGENYSYYEAIDAPIVIPAGESRDVSYEITGLIVGDKCWIDYCKPGTFTDITDGDAGVVTLEPGIVTINQDGTLYSIAPTANYVAPATATCVDMTGITTLPKVTPSANPNCLYVVDAGKTLYDNMDMEITDNVIKGGVAASIVLEDNANGFVTPVDFTAAKITYTRTFDKFYSAGKGWTTIVLPFAATKVENSEGTLPWDVANRKFWLMEFSGEAGSTVNFTTPTTLAANTPYIIALPGDDQGALSLKDAGKHTLTFSADNADIKANAKAAVTVSKYKFVGTMTNTGSLDDIYALNGDGDKFTKGTATVEPFRAYFAGTSAAATATSLGIGFGDGISTGIESLQLAKPEAKREGIYNLNGQRVSQPRKGLYIVNGKKVVIK